MINIILEITCDVIGIMTLGWVWFYVILIEKYGVVTVNAPLGEAPFEIFILAFPMVAMIRALILDLRGKR